MAIYDLVLCELDLKNAYHQLAIDDATRAFVTINAQHVFY